MTRRWSDAARGAAAVAVLFAITAVLPFALGRFVGWPLPRAVPTWAAVSRALTNGDVADSTWLKAVACVAWLAWAQFTVAVIRETVEQARGRVARQVRGVAWPVQAVAGRLVATAALVASSLAPRAAAMPVPLATAVPIVQVSAAAPPSLYVVDPPEAASVTTEAAPSAPTWTVARRDTLWSIAERALGDGERYREIFDLNRGVVQPDGDALARPDVIRPGWVLKLPLDSTLSRGATGATQYEVRPGDTLWEVAERTTGDGHRAGDVFALNRGRPQPDGRELDDPDLIRPGWILEVPAARPSAAVEEPEPTTPVASAPSPAPAPEPHDARPAPATTEAATDTVLAPRSDAGREVRTPSAQDVEVDADDGASIADEVAVGTLLFAGVALTLERLRRVQQRRRTSGRRIRMPEPDLAAAETVMRASAAPGRLADVADVQRAVLGINGIGSEVHITHVRSTSDGPIIVPSRTGQPPDGFALVRDGWRPEPADELRGGGAVAMPTLVPIGRDGDDEILLDLESCAVVGLAGDAGRVGDVARALALSLATSAWADDVELVLVGVDLDVESLPWVSAAPSLHDALARAEARLAEVEEALSFAQVPTSLAGRAAGVLSEAWEPFVIVSLETPDDAQRERIAAIASRPRRCVAIVVPGEVAGSRWCFDVDVSGRLSVPPLGLTLDAHVVNPRVGNDVAELIANACDERDVEHEAPVEEPPIGPEDATSGEPAEVVVRLLGDVEVVRAGEAVVFDRAKSLEAVVYLALHPAGTTKDALQQALWPEGDNAEGTWHQTISKARRAMGETADGTPYFPPVVSTGGAYRLSEAVASDHAEFVRLSSAASLADDDIALKLLREALAMVRGEPIAGRGVAYAWRPGTAAAIEADVVDAAERMAELCLAAGDGKGAEWASRQGLLASPYDERLYRLLMLAADAEGNPAGVRRVLHELTAKLELDVEPLDSLHPETVELYERLTERRGKASA